MANHTWWCVFCIFPETVRGWITEKVPSECEHCPTQATLCHKIKSSATATLKNSEPGSGLIRVKCLCPQCLYNIFYTKIIIKGEWEGDVVGWQIRGSEKEMYQSHQMQGIWCLKNGIPYSRGAKILLQEGVWTSSWAWAQINVIRRLKLRVQDRETSSLPPGLWTGQERSFQELRTLKKKKYPWI